MRFAAKAFRKLDNHPRRQQVDRLRLRVVVEPTSRTVSVTWPTGSTRSFTAVRLGAFPGGMRE